MGEGREAVIAFIGVVTMITIVAFSSLGMLYYRPKYMFSMSLLSPECEAGLYEVVEMNYSLRIRMCVEVVNKVDKNVRAQLRVVLLSSDKEERFLLAVKDLVLVPHLPLRETLVLSVPKALIKNSAYLALELWAYDDESGEYVFTGRRLTTSLG